MENIKYVAYLVRQELLEFFDWHFRFTARNRGFASLGVLYGSVFTVVACGLAPEPTSMAVVEREHRIAVALKLARDD